MVTSIVLLGSALSYRRKNDKFNYYILHFAPSGDSFSNFVYAVKKRHSATAHGK